MKIWTEPKVTRVGYTVFVAPEHLPVKWGDDRSSIDSERLIEFAGRLCYMSQHNPAGKTTEQYIDHIIEVDHGSVLEHVSVSFLIEGVSRSLTHELVRHRVGVAYSQLSQRFVEGFDAVVPPAVLQFGETSLPWILWHNGIQSAEADYRRLIGALQGDDLKGKQLREAARSLLPNCAETKLVMTGNVRAWRQILRRRVAPEADAEIQRLSREILRQLQELLPSCSKDFKNG